MIINEKNFSEYSTFLPIPFWTQANFAFWERFDKNLSNFWNTILTVWHIIVIKSQKNEEVRDVCASLFWWVWVNIIKRSSYYWHDLLFTSHSDLDTMTLWPFCIILRRSELLSRGTKMTMKRRETHKEIVALWVFEMQFNGHRTPKTLSTFYLFVRHFSRCRPEKQVAL